MRWVILGLGVLAAATSGCTTVEVNPLCNELTCQWTPPHDPDQVIAKRVAVVAPFEDARMLNGANRTTCAHPLVTFVPLVPCTTSVQTHPEVTCNLTESDGTDHVRAVGTLPHALPKVLVDYMKRSGRLADAACVESAKASGGSTGHDVILRGRLVESKLTTTFYGYCLGPLAVVPYALGAPITRHSVSLVIEWQLYDSSGKKIGDRVTALVEEPVAHYRGAYYGYQRNGKDVPFGLYVGAVKDVNGRIAQGVYEKLTEH